MKSKRKNFTEGDKKKIVIKWWYNKDKIIKTTKEETVNTENTKDESKSTSKGRKKLRRANENDREWRIKQ